MHVEDGEVVCWSRMQAEAGQALRDIVVRKELERRSGGGLFCWGVGNAPGTTATKLVLAGIQPEVVFSVMKGRPKAADLRPTAVVVWKAYIGADGRRRPLPDHCLVTSRTRGGTWDASARHYALICRSEEELVLGDYGPFDPNVHRNLGGTGATVGASQVTALLRRTSKSGEGGKYRVNMRAKLDLDLWVRLADPVPLCGARFDALQGLNTNLASGAWLKLVAWLRDVHPHRFVAAPAQPALL